MSDPFPVLFKFCWVIKDDCNVVVKARGPVAFARLQAAAQPLQLLTAEAGQRRRRLLSSYDMAEQREKERKSGRRIGGRGEDGPR